MIRGSSGCSGCCWTRFLTTVGILIVFPGGATVGNEAGGDTSVQRLVAEARDAELVGDSARRFALLREAVKIAPEHQIARWQLGQVQVDGNWVAAEEVQRRAAADPRQADYRERRKALGEAPEGQLALARWCRKNGLDEEARFHWASVLSVAPNHEEALRAVEMRWQNGRLLSREETVRQREQLREAKQAAKRWASAIAKWRRAVSGSDIRKRQAALDEIRALANPEVIPALEAVTLGRDATRKTTAEECRQICLAFLEALGVMPEPAATQSLVRHALFAPAAEAQASAIDKLKERPQHEYVPLLLAGLAMPIESSFHMRTEPDGSVHYTHSLYREGAEQDFALDARFAVMQNDIGGRRFIRDQATGALEIGPPTGAEPAAMRRKASIVSRSERRFGTLATATEWQVRQLNEATEALNEAILHVLRESTGQDHGSNPTQWWDWWREQNEYYVSDEKKPVDQRYVSDTESHYYGEPAYSVRRLPPQPSSGNYRVVRIGPTQHRPWTPMSACCFAKGTLVWTKVGQQPIESLELGDLVLSQDVHTGELAFRPVVSRIVRPTSQLLKLSLNGEEVRASAGHPLWVAGIGWRMAKEIEDGAILHGVTGSPHVDAVESDGEEEAYNLVVADFNTYFVGQSGLLVHDNTPRRPTRATVPGLAAK